MIFKLKNINYFDKLYLYNLVSFILLILYFYRYFHFCLSVTQRFIIIKKLKTQPVVIIITTTSTITTITRYL